MTRWPLLLGSFSVLTFVIANAVGVQQTMNIDRLASQIAADGRVIEQLSAVRTTLRDLTSAQVVAINAALEGPTRDDFVLPTVLVARLDEQLTRLRGLVPGGNHELPTLERQARAAVDDMTHISALLEDHQVEDARRAMRNEMRRDADAADRTAERLGALEAERVEALGDDIRRARDRMGITSAILNALAAGLVLIVMLFAGRAMRAHSRIVRERERAAEERTHELGQFAGRVAHDLRGPLGAMQLRIQMAQRASPDTPVWTPLLGQIRTMTRLIDDLLGFALAGAKPEAGAGTPLREVVGDVVSTVDPETVASGAALVVAEVPEVFVACSRGALTSVLSNLLRNALKYVADGSSERRVSLRATCLEQSVHLEIEDTGPGIPSGAEEAIFQPYVRLESARRLPGAGLGLATVKRLVEAYGGAVGVRSREGKGSTFWVDLPVAPTEPRPRELARWP